MEDEEQLFQRARRLRRRPEVDWRRARAVLNWQRGRRHVPWRRLIPAFLAAPVVVWLVAVAASCTFVRIPASGSRQTLVFYSAPTRLAPGASLDQDELEDGLRRLGYAPGDPPLQPGQYRDAQDGLEIHLRPFAYPGHRFRGGNVRVHFRGGDVEEIEHAEDLAREDLRLEPERIASFEGGTGAVLDYLPLEEAPPLLVDAVIGIEDTRFWNHPGIDAIGVARALRVNLRRGEAAQGGSTLTQQLARSLFLQNDKTLLRKAQEGILAMGLELRYSKRQILEGYLNAVYWGHWGPYEIRGAREASRFYLGRDLEKADPAGLALLAGLIRAPNHYSPYVDPARAKDRRDFVLGVLRDKKALTEAEYEAAVKRGLPRKKPPSRPADASFFLEAVRKEIDARAPRGTLGREGISIFTTMDPREQAIAVAGLQRGIRKLETDHRELRRKERLEGAAVVIDPANGEVKALVGGRDFIQRPFNRATEALRQPGSLFKPFVYLTAFRHPLREDGSAWTPVTWIPDEPIELRAGNRIWSPQNYDKEYRGSVTLRYALEQSLNVPTALVGYEVGIDRVAETARDMGIQSDLDEVPSLALGTSEVTLLEITGAYAGLAAAGQAHTPSLLRGLMTGDGDMVRLRPLYQPHGVEPQEAYMITRLLQGVITSGTGRAAGKWGVHGAVAGKTGTTDDYRDAWFVGFNPRRAAGVWVGFDRRRAIGLSGAAAALPIWAGIFAEIQGDRSDEGFPVPPGVITAPICSETGLHATEWCPGVVKEVFLDGTAPGNTCDIHHGGFFDRLKRFLNGDDPGEGDWYDLDEPRDERDAYRRNDEEDRYRPDPGHDPRRR